MLFDLMLGIVKKKKIMEEKLQEILNNSSEDIERYKADESKLIARIEFCQTHNFAEEERITRVKYDAISMIIYRWGKMHQEVQELLNAWNS